MIRGVLTLGLLAAIHDAANAKTKEERLRAEHRVRQALGSDGRPTARFARDLAPVAWNYYAEPRERNLAKARRRRLRAAGAHP